MKKLAYFDNQKTTPSKEVNYDYNYFGTTRSSGIESSSFFHEPVSYRNVTVWETGIGKTEYSYTSLFDFVQASGSNPVTQTYYDYRIGLLKKQKVFFVTRVHAFDTVGNIRTAFLFSPLAKIVVILCSIFLFSYILMKYVILQRRKKKSTA